MPSLTEVKHTAANSAVREKSKNSHADKGQLRVRLSCNSIVDKDNHGYSVTYMQSGRYQMAYGSSLRIRNFKVSLPDEEVVKASLFLSINGCVSFVQSISPNDFTALFHTFNPEKVDDELNLLSTSEDEVIATSTDQVPAAGTNNA